MPPNVYCPLCRIVLLADPYRDDPASLQTRVRPWYAEVRGIYSANATSGDICMTGLGITRCRNTLYAPFGHDLSYVDVWTEALEEWRLCEPSENRWCFSFHHSCWRLLLLRLGHGQADCVQDEMAIADKLDWSQLFFWTRASLKAGLLPLVNRKRIRQLLEPIAALVDQEAVFQNGPYGSAFHMQGQGNCFQLDGDSTGKLSQPLEIAGSFSGQIASIGADIPLNEGCRVLYHRTQPFMSSFQHSQQQMGISTVQIGVQSFISEINLFQCPIGYRIPASEKWI